MKTLIAILCAATLAAGARAEEAPEQERALILTIKWDQSGPSIEKVEKKEDYVPLQRGMPQMWSRFFEVRDANGDVHFSGPLVSSIPQRDGPAAVEHRVIIPDMPDARKLVIIERVAPDPKKGRKVWLEKDL